MESIGRIGTRCLHKLQFKSITLPDIFFQKARCQLCRLLFDGFETEEYFFLTELGIDDEECVFNRILRQPFRKAVKAFAEPFKVAFGCLHCVNLEKD